MNRKQAWLRLSGLVWASALAFFFPIYIAIVLVADTVLQTGYGLRKGHKSFLAFGALTVAIDALLIAWTSPGTGELLSIGPLVFGMEGAMQGALGGLRLVAILGVNLVWLQRVSVASVIDHLGLPRRATVFLAAVLIAVQDIGRDFERLVQGRKLGEEWPRSKWRRPFAAASLVTPLLVASVQRAKVRRDALQVAGFQPSKAFVPLVALTALALAGRLALVAVPNVSLVHAVVFVGGVVFGPWIAAAAALLAMGLSDLLISGLVPTAFVNAPAMALVGLLGGLLARINYSTSPGKILAGAMGVAATLIFSIAADVSEWLLVPEFRGDIAFLQIRLVGGLAFNAAPAIIHGLLFALVTGPVQQAFTIPSTQEESESSPTLETHLP